MYFIRHLKLLCWKNYVSKKRNLIRLAIEVLLPILLFIVLMFLRRIGDKKIYPDCYFKPKAMPSAGDLAFYQGFYCSLNNTCDDSVANASLSIYDGSLVSSVMRAVEEAFDLRPPDPSRSSDDDEDNAESGNLNGPSSQAVRKYLDILRSTINLDPELAATDLGVIVSSLTVPDEDTSKKYQCGALPFGRRRGRREVDDPGGSGRSGVNDLGNSGQKEVKDFGRRVVNDSDSTLQNDAETNDTNAGGISADSFGLDAIVESPWLKMLDKILCGPDVPQFAKQILSLSGQGEKTWERKKEEIESQSLSTSARDMEFLEPEFENDTSPFCNNLMRSMEMSLETRIVWRLFKPFVRGKILFTPDAPVLRRLMGRINDSFARPRDVISNLMKATGQAGLKELTILRDNQILLRRLAASELGADILRVLGMKSDGDAGNEKTNRQDETALRKLLEQVISVYSHETTRSQAPMWQEQLLKYIECIDWSRVIGYSSVVEAEAAALNWLKPERLWALVEFLNVPSDAEELPPGVTLKIRTGIERTHGTFQIRDRVYRPKVRRDPLIDLKHITGGWAYIQNLVESEIIREQTGRKNVPGIYLQQTPYPCHIKDMFRESITRTLPMFMIVSWIFLFSMLIRRIVWEKEKKVTQTLRVMGVGKASHWLAWFIDAFVPMFAVSFLLSFILVFGKIIPFSSFVVVWIFLIAFIFPTIALAFLVSTFFSKASFAAAVSGFLFLLIYLPYPPVSQYEERLDPNFKISLCLVSNIAFGLGCTWLANMEELAIGGHLWNMHVSPVPGNPINMYLILGMLLLDAVIYFLLALYIENVFPGGDVAGRPFYFLLTADYWFGAAGEKQSQGVNVSLSLDPSKFEADPTDMIVGVSVKNLCKRYSQKLAINNLTLSFYENQITSFLGHNGAGKSTAISIMTGMTAATAGEVKLYGENFSNDCEIRNRNIGICSQENVLLEDLTVEEHLYFFACMKGVSDEEARKDAEKIMFDVGILPKRNALVKFLSGGTQRKVCVAIALIGGSKIIFLDEPTAGVDPSARRSIWDLLIKYKTGRTIVLTTHFMDEADLLGDRIAIIAKGELVCCGSPVFLKANLGSGHYLTVDCRTKSHMVGRAVRGPEEEQSLLVQELKQTMQAVLPTLEFLEEIGSEIVFVVPQQTNVGIYSQLFFVLEELKSNGKIESYGISDTSLEEIFLKMTQESETQQYSSESDGICSCFKWMRAPKYDSVATNEVHINGAGNGIIHRVTEVSQTASISFIEKMVLHFFALTVKRALHHIRNYKALIVEIVVPAAFVAMAVYLSSLLPSLQMMPAQEIDISAYAPSHIFYSMDAPQSLILKAYERELLSSTGLGPGCAAYPGKCSSKRISNIYSPIEQEDTSPCPCSNGRYSCSIAPSVPPWAEMSSGDRLYNLTGRNITNWIVKTELADSYIRYGGISFGYPRAFTALGSLNLLQLFRVENLLPFISAIGRRSEVSTSENALDSLSTDDIINILLVACSKSAGEEMLNNVDFNDNIVIWYNNRGWISGIAFMNAVSNLVLRASLPPDKDPSQYYIRVINHPLPITARQFEDEIDKQSNVSLLRAMVIIWALAFIPATYAVYLIGERASGFKHLQIISGVGKVMYWIATFIWDFTCFALTIFILVLIFLCYQDEAFVGRDSIGAFLTLMFAYATVSITFVYPLSFCFNIPSSGFVAVSTLNVFIGMITLLTTFVLTLVQDEENPFYLNTIFMIFPQFCLGKSLLNMSIIAITVKTLATFGVIERPNYFAWDTSMKYVVVMLVLAVLCFLMTLALEFRIFKFFDRGEGVSEEYLDEDDDVAAERARVLGDSGGLEDEEEVLLLKNLSKRYRGQKRPAVDRLCLSVQGGQCFGLLGLNGAGKSTVFKMLTGSLRPTLGEASILGEPIRDGGGIQLGYCPQGNALDPYLTCDEHLAFFARLHGLRGEDVASAVARNIERLGIEIHRNKMSKALSGGNKRKLNTALALVGEPRLVLLDEPTSGMDPRARRFLWQCVQKCVLEGRCVVLTSHSMEECQTLCTRLSILVNGRFQCLGTCQHLKSKFDEGYSVTIRVSSLDLLAAVKVHLTEKLPTTGEVQVNYLQMKLRLSPGADLSNVFSVLDAAKQDHRIRDYSISQTTLEQIFLSFAESQGISSDSDQLPSRLLSLCCPFCLQNGPNELDRSPRLPSRLLVQEIDDDNASPNGTAANRSNGGPTHDSVRRFQVESATKV